MTAALDHFDLQNKGANYKTVKHRATELGIDLSQLLKKGQAQRIKAIKNFNIKSLDEILVENSTHKSTYHLKNRLQKHGLLPNECQICGQGPIWNGKPLMLVLDHINGSNRDNRITNLRILCGHCHSQTQTFAGRNRRCNHSQVV